jgi:hypothetical protein
MFLLREMYVLDVFLLVHRRGILGVRVDLSRFCRRDTIRGSDRYMNFSSDATVKVQTNSSQQDRTDMFCIIALFYSCQSGGAISPTITPIRQGSAVNNGIEHVLHGDPS